MLYKKKVVYEGKKYGLWNFIIMKLGCYKYFELWGNNK